jgi:poly(3-hydroxybutyrate) depolymerase
MLTTGSPPLLFASLLCAVSFPAAAMPAQQQTTRIELRSYEFEDAGREVDYALYVPESYHEESPAPLVVLLHGLGSNPGQVMRYQGITAEAERRGYIVVAPYGYNERGWYGSRGHGKKGPYFGNAKDPDNLGELSEKDVMNVLGIVRAEFRVDPERIFLMGHSMGGAGTIYLGATHNGIWAGLAPMAPAVGGSMDLLRDLESIPVFVVTGDQDRLVRVELVRRWVKEMERLGVRCRYEEIEGGDHVRAIAANPQLIGRVFEFFDGLRKQAAATEAGATGDGQPAGDPPAAGEDGKVERKKT